MENKFNYYFALVVAEIDKAKLKLHQSLRKCGFQIIIANKHYRF